MRESDVYQFLSQVDDPDREGLRDTPARVRKAWEFWTSGYGQDPMEIMRSFADGAEQADEIIFQGGISFFSTCEHHLAPFWGVAHIGYLPNGRILGLSKFARLVDIFARRLQTQERIGAQIADALEQGLTPRGVGVVLQCRHTCMESRGVQRIGSVTITSVLRGMFKQEPAMRAEFLTLVTAAGMGFRSL